MGKSNFTKYKRQIDHVNSTAARLEHDLHFPVSLIVIPLFALANTGIAGVAWLAVKLDIAKLPEGSSMSQVFGVAFLGNDTLIFQAKV